MSLNNELNTYVNLYNNNIAQINNLYYNNAILQNNIYLIRQRMTQIPVPAPVPAPAPAPIRTEPLNRRPHPRRRRHRNTTTIPHSYSITTPTPAFQVPPTPTSTPAQPRQTTSPPAQQPPQPTAIMRRRPTTFTQSFFDPVIIYPTQRQIENATKLIQYDTIINPTNESCPFTCEPFHNQDLVRQILHCGHIFSPSQFNTWFYSNVSCPICRYDIRTYQPQTIINNEELIPTNRENTPTRENHEVQPIQERQRQRLTEPETSAETSPETSAETSPETQLVNEYLDLLFSSLLQPNTRTTNSSSSTNSNRLFFEYIIREL